MLAEVRSSLREERHRANTDSPVWRKRERERGWNESYSQMHYYFLPMSVKGIPLSRAEMAVHFPVPFCPAASLIFSTRGVPSVSYEEHT